MEVLGRIQIIAYYIKTDLPISKNVKNKGWVLFFYFLKKKIQIFFNR
jgi:hypothetical protein